MKGDNHLLALSTTVDEVTGEVKPLFSFPVQVCKATDDGGDVTFDNAAPSGGNIILQRIDEVTGETFEYADRLRGVKVGDEFKAIDAEAIKNIDAQTKVKTMVALGSLPLDVARSAYGDRVTGRYFLQVPAKGGSAMAYKLTYEALLAEKAAVVVKRTPRSRQKLNYIYADADQKCLVLVEVAFAAAVREPDEQILAPQTAKVEAKQIQMARKLIKAMPSGATALENEVDEAVALRAELVEKAIAGEAIEAPVPVATSTATDDLAAALEASLAQS